MSSDELALKLTRAMHDLNVDDVIATLHAQDRLPGRQAQLTSNLRPIFTAAGRDNVSLLRPPADFQPWLQAVLLTNADGSEAKPNTQVSRAAALRALYRALRKLELLSGDPLVDFKVPSAEHRSDPLPSKETLEALLKAAKRDSNLHAALLLLWHHAVPLSTLLRLKWSAFDPNTHTLLRGDVISDLSSAAGKALDKLHRKAGYHPLFPETLQETAVKRMFPYDTVDALRLRILLTCREAGLDFIPPGLIKRCALRDHARSAAHLGYRLEGHYEKVVKLAQGAVDKR